MFWVKSSSFEGLYSISAFEVERDNYHAYLYVYVLPSNDRVYAGKYAHSEIDEILDRIYSGISKSGGIVFNEVSKKVRVLF